MPRLVDQLIWCAEHQPGEVAYVNLASEQSITFAGWDEADLRKVLGETAASVYGFDLAALAPIAAAHGPSVADVAAPLGEVPADATSPAFTRT